MCPSVQICDHVCDAQDTVILVFKIEALVDCDGTIVAFERACAFVR